MEEKKVSVVVPCYNHAEYVVEAIESILNQTYKNIELIVADNGSTDNSYDVIMGYKDRIKVIRLEKNNPPLCERELVAASSGDYIAHMTADDYWEPEKLEKQMKVFEENPNVKVCTTWALFCNENLVPYENQQGNPFLVSNCSSDEWFRRLIYGDNMLAYPSAVVEREHWLYLVNHRHGYFQLADYECWVKSSLMIEMYVVTEPLVLFRWHTGGNNANASALSTPMMVRTEEERCEIIRNAFEMMTDEKLERLIGKKCKSHAEVLCEKFFWLKEINEKKNYRINSCVTRFYYDHYIEFTKELEDHYSFSFADGMTLCGELGYYKKLSDLNEAYMNEKKKNIRMEASLKEFIGILNGDYLSTDQTVFIKKRLFSSFEGEHQRIISIIYNALDRIVKFSGSSLDVFQYNSLIFDIEDVISCIKVVFDEMVYLGIIASSEEFDLLGELISIAKTQRIDLDECIIPYLTELTEKLKTVLEQ